MSCCSNSSGFTWNREEVDTRSLPRIDESQTQKYGNLESIIGLGGKVLQPIWKKKFSYIIAFVEDDIVRVFM